jgi:hypothetical protein
MAIWIGDRLILAAPADPEYLRQDPRTILMSAGQAFGTGTHPTSQMCLLLANLDTAADGAYWLPTLSRLCRGGGKIVLSGFQPPGEGRVQQALEEANLARLARRPQESWITSVLGKPA